jgi:hypothetical protein
VDFEELGDLLGQSWPMILWGCAFEDLLGRRYGAGGDNVADLYLKPGMEGAGADAGLHRGAAGCAGQPLRGERDPAWPVDAAPRSPDGGRAVDGSGEERHPFPEALGPRRRPNRSSAQPACDLGGTPALLSRGRRVPDGRAQARPEDREAEGAAPLC